MISERSTADYIERKLRRMMSKFKIEKKVSAAVTDRGSNMVKAARDLGVPHEPCFSHNLNSVVRSTFNLIASPENLRSKVSSMVTSCKKSATMKRNFENCQTLLQLPVKSLLQSCLTRWNSEYLMFERFLDLQDPLTLFLNHDMSDVVLTREDWRNLREVTKILKSFCEVTVHICYIFHGHSDVKWWFACTHSNSN